MSGNLSNGFIFNFDNSFTTIEDFDFIRVLQIGEINIQPSREIQLHTQTCHEITYIISGKGEFYSGGQKDLLQPGDIHVITKGVDHRIVPDPGNNLRFANIGFDFCGELNESLQPLQDLFSGDPYFCLRDKGEVRLLMTMLINEMYSKSAYNHLMVESYLKQILVTVYRLAMAEQTKVFDPKRTDNRYGLSVYSIIRYVDNNFYEFPDIADIAKALGYSQSYISHRFREKMGITLQDYICKKKIEASLDFLKYRKNSVTQIAMIMNYSSVQSFCKAFRKIMGCSPTEYQQRFGTDNEQPKEVEYDESC